MTTAPLLEVNSLTLDYHLNGKKMRALDRDSFSLEKGQVMGAAAFTGYPHDLPLFQAETDPVQGPHFFTVQVVIQGQ